MASLLDLAQARLQGLLDIPTRVGRAVVNPTLFSGLLGAPTLPKETGMAQAAYGLPAQPNMSVLDPEQRAYLEGYAQGEPYSYLGMATPFAAPAVAAGAKAVAPKAGMALENYMASQGLLQPLTAYHGSPASFTKFDKSKIGSGSGLDYGYGGYFAEAPETAKQFQAALSNRKYTVDGKELKGNDAWAAQFLHDFSGDALPKRIDVNTAISRANEILDDPKTKLQIINKIKKLDKENLNVEAGNLYKVDIPDQYLPKMINWSSSEQTKEVNEILQKAGLPTNVRGEDIYFAAIEKVGSSDAQKSGFQKAAEYLDSLGIKGITYPQRNYENNNVTKNFVVFDPTDVKILEKNSQKVEGLLE
jgi:hypothetical protein